MYYDSDDELVAYQNVPSKKSSSSKCSSRRASRRSKSKYRRGKKLKVIGHRTEDGFVPVQPPEKKTSKKSPPKKRSYVRTYCKNNKCMTDQAKSLIDVSQLPLMINVKDALPSLDMGEVEAVDVLNEPLFTKLTTEATNATAITNKINQAYKVLQTNQKSLMRWLGSNREEAFTLNFNDNKIQQVPSQLDPGQKFKNLFIVGMNFSQWNDPSWYIHTYVPRNKDAIIDQLQKFPWSVPAYVLPLLIPSVEDIQTLLHSSVDYTLNNGGNYTPAVDVIVSVDGMCCLYPTKELIDLLMMDDNPDQRDIRINNLAYQYGYNAFIDAVRTSTNKEQVLRKWINLVAVDKFMFGGRNMNTFHIYMFPFV